MFKYFKSVTLMYFLSCLEQWVEIIFVYYHCKANNEVSMFSNCFLENIDNGRAPKL